MSGSIFGKIFTLTTFGESHGTAIGGVIQGVPAGFELDVIKIQQELDRRKPGQSSIVTQRKENDQVQFLSGILDTKTLGTPIGFMIANEDQKSKDYQNLDNVFRPSHADFTYQQKYGFYDHRGGGRSSARETANWVVAGAIAKQILAKIGVEFSTYVDQVGALRFDLNNFFEQAIIDSNPVRCPDENLAFQMENLIKQIKKEGDTIGGAIKCIIRGVPRGLGEPVFEKLHAALGKAFFSINAVKGVEFGSGFSSVSMKGSEHNDIFNEDGSTKTNRSGGIQGGISNGMPIDFRIAFKPVATIMQNQESINANFEKVELQAKGRHDACVVPRAVPIVEALAAMTILDFYLRSKAEKI